MASKNPFGKLTVRRDQEDEEEFTQTQQNTQQTTGTTSTGLFNTQTDVKKKKKVRPEEKKELENKGQTASHIQEEDDSGFSIVKKKIPVNRTKVTTDENTDEKSKKPLKNKGAYADRNAKVAPGKRQFERHSGTGRGKEISKGGAGGKYTWGGNTKTTNADFEEYDNYQDNLFNRALNPKPKTEETENKETYSPEKKELETKPVENEQPLEGDKKEETEAEKPEGEDTYADKRKKKKGVEVEVKKEDLLERPENALSYSEYLEQMKQKNQKIVGQTKTVTKPAEVNDLKETAKNETQFEIGASGAAKKQNKPKPKEKKVDTKEQEINSLVGASLGTEEERWDNRDRNQNRGGYQNRKKEAKFQFKAEDFPEL